jgi:hypothetical protein
MARITISLPTTLARAARTTARSERRSLSAHVARLIELDADSEGDIQLLTEARRLGVNTREVLAEAVRTAVVVPMTPSPDTRPAA